MIYCSNADERDVRYIHIGHDTAVRAADIIGVFDIDNTTTSRHTRKFLSKQEAEGKVINIAPDIPVSFVVCEGEYPCVYLSQYSPATILRSLGLPDV